MKLTPTKYPFKKSIDLTAEQAAWLQEMADADSTSANAVVRRALTEHYAAWKRARREFEQAMSGNKN